MEIVVVGGGAAGMSVASKAKRVNPSINVTVLERGKYVSYAECGIPYLLEGIVKGPEDLLHYPVEEFTKKRGISVRTGTGVVEIRRKEHSLVLSDGSIMQYDKLILALGAIPKIPEQFASIGIPGIRTLESGEQVRSMLEGSEKVAVIGDGVL
ncbi:FAD-dependent pyridine nucleotide-disulfide oxidoreductase, partial [mine drainage metagenome]